MSLIEGSDSLSAVLGGCSASQTGFCFFSGVFDFCFLVVLSSSDKTILSCFLLQFFFIVLLFTLRFAFIWNVFHLWCEVKIKIMVFCVESLLTQCRLFKRTCIFQWCLVL